MGAPAVNRWAYTSEWMPPQSCHARMAPPPRESTLSRISRIPGASRLGPHPFPSTHDAVDPAAYNQWFLRENAPGDDAPPPL